MPHKIETVHCFIVTDDDGEGLMAVLAPDGMWMPLVSCDEARLKSLVPLAQGVSRISGKPFRIIRMSGREDVTTEVLAKHGTAPEGT